MLWSQDVLLSETVDSTYKSSSFGPNSRHFIHVYCNFGFVFGETGQKAVVTKFGSNNIGLGLRYKLKIMNSIATGVDLELNAQNIFYPDHDPVLKEKYNILDIKYAWYARINFGKRGDIMGKFLDFGVWGASTCQSSKFLKTKVENKDYQYLESYQKELKYINTFNYGFLARLGYEQFVIYVQYRYSDFLKQNFHDTYQNIPAWTVGLQIGLHR
jgi:hypothetical protein